MPVNRGKRINKEDSTLFAVGESGSPPPPHPGQLTQWEWLASPLSFSLFCVGQEKYLIKVLEYKK